MGAEAPCKVAVGRQRATGKALLETDALIFRGGDIRLSIPYKQISAVSAKDGALHVEWPDGKAAFHIGAAAAKWADKIRNPRSRAEKLGIKAGQRVLLVGLTDAQLSQEIESRGASVSTVAARDVDVIFYAAESSKGLALKLRGALRQLRRDGAIWIVRPKGHPEVSEADVMKAGKEAGLVDVKVVRFSDTHTAEKFVIRVRDR